MLMNVLKNVIHFVCNYLWILVCTYQALQSNDKEQIDKYVLRWGTMGMVLFCEPIINPILNIIPGGQILMTLVYIMIFNPYISLGEFFFASIYAPLCTEQSFYSIIEALRASFVAKLSGDYTNILNDLHKTVPEKI